MSKYKYKTLSDSDLIMISMDGERVNLVGESVEITLPSTKKRPSRKAVVRGITDADVEKLLSNPEKYGDWSGKFIDTTTGFTVKFLQPVKGTLKENSKKNDAADKQPKPKAKAEVKTVAKEKTSKQSSKAKDEK